MQSDLILFEIRSESLNKSAMSCCSFVGIYCCVYANVMNSEECSSSSVATMVQRAKLTAIIKNTDLPLAAKRWASIKPGTWNIPEHSGTCRNIPEHEKINIIFMKKKYNKIKIIT